MFQVFVSHSSKDRAFVEREIIPLLNEHGIRTWYSKDDIPTATEWEDKIRTALAASDWVLVILSPDAISSQWVRAEVHRALEKKGSRIVPLLYRDCDPTDLHLRLGLIQHIDYRHDRELARAKLLGIWQNEPSPKPRRQAPPAGTSVAQTVPGQCPNCGRRNLADRKFCGGCGDPLEEPCLNCEHVNPAQDKFCGKCGADILALRTQRMRQLDANMKKADALRNEKRYVEVIALLKEIAFLKHPRLKTFAFQAKELLPTLQTELVQAGKQKDDLVRAAETSFSKHDYAAVVKAVAQIPNPLRTPQLEYMHDDCRTKAVEVTSLRTAIEQEIQKGEFATISKSLQRYLELRPYPEEARKLAAKWLGHISGTAQAKVKAYQYSAAAALVRQVPDVLRDQGMNRLLWDAKDHSEEVESLKGEMTRARKAGDTKLLLTQLLRFLELKPNYEQGRKFISKTLQTHWQAAQENASNHEYDKAVKLLEQVPESLRDDEMRGFLKEAQVKAAEVELLRNEFRKTQVVGAEDFGWFLPKLSRLLHLNPNDDQAKRLVAGMLGKEPDQCQREEIENFNSILDIISRDDMTTARSRIAEILTKNPEARRLLQLITFVEEDIVGELWRHNWLNSGEVAESEDPCSFDESDIFREDYLKSCIAYSPDGRKITVGRHGNIALIDAHTGFLLSTIDLLHNHNVKYIAFSRHSRHILTGDRQDLRLFDCETGKEIRHFKGHRGNVLGVSFAPDGCSVLSAGEDNSICRWDMKTGEEVRGGLMRRHLITKPCKSNCLWSAAFSGDGKVVAICGANRLDMWSVEDGRRIRTIDNSPYYGVEYVAVSGHGDYVAVAPRIDKRLIIHVWNMETGGRLHLAGHKGPITSLAISTDGTRILSGSKDGTVRLWDMVSGDEICILQMPTKAGEMVTTENEKKTFHMGIFVPVVDPVGKVGDINVAFSPDGRRVVAATRNTVVLWALPKAQHDSTSDRRADAGVAPSTLKKVGRNSPCPCGSGRKYRNCCGRT